jgi:hypothetical protein
LTPCNEPCNLDNVVPRTRSQGSVPEAPAPDVIEIEGSTVSADWGRIHVSGRYVLVGDHHVPEELTLELDGDEGRPSTIARMVVQAGRPELVEVRLISRPGEPGIRQTDLRQIEVAAMLDLLAGYAVRIEDGTVTWGGPEEPAYAAAAGALKQSRSARRITPEFLQSVADVYVANIDQNPTQAVRRHYFVSERMASEYVQRARRAGLLPPTTPGRKKV